ncbi:MAG: complex I NDUFA9 subunit family protein [Pseudomonadota bacterium]
MKERRTATVFGGTGFVGRYVVQQLSEAGWDVRVFSRSAHGTDLGQLPGVTFLSANICDVSAVEAALVGSQAVVNLVAVLNSVGPQNFEVLHVDAANNVARAAADHKIERFVHVSSIGSHPDASSDYSRTKGLGEQAVLQHHPNAIILRPSLIFGPKDGLFNRFAEMARFGPLLPIFGGTTRFQPVYAGDVAQAVIKGITEEATPGTYELGGPDIETLAQLMHRMLSVIGWRRQVINLPFTVGMLMGNGLDLLQNLSGGMFENTLVTADQIATLKSDNVVAPDAKSLADMGIVPTPMSEILPKYLNKYNP